MYNYANIIVAEGYGQRRHYNMKKTTKEKILLSAKVSLNPENFIEYIFYWNLTDLFTKEKLSKEDKLELLEAVK